MEQVLTNLIDNALRHTPEKGSVTVQLSKIKHSIRYKGYRHWLWDSERRSTICI